MQTLSMLDIEQVAGAGLSNAEVLQYQQQAASGTGTPAAIVATVFLAQAIIAAGAEDRVASGYRPKVG